MHTTLLPRSATIFRYFLFLICLVITVWPNSARGDVRLPGFFTDHMVLQQQKPIVVWGWADAGESVTVALGTDEVTTMADSAGKWRVQLPAVEASSHPHTLTVKGKTNERSLTDVLVGEVWLCSGQSNMEWTVASSQNRQHEIANADYPLIRHMKVAHRPSMTPLDDIESQWQVCSPETVGAFTACGYFMARRLHQGLKVPIGLINSSWGGTRVEPWTPPVGFEKVEATKDIYTSVMGRTPGTKEYEGTLAEHQQALRSWLQQTSDNRITGSSVEPSPNFPDSLRTFQSHQDPTMLYNGMIHALVGFPIRGAIWYQGESNHTEGLLYFAKKKALIQGWRELWGEDFPFYFVQIAPYQYGNEDPTILAEFWEAQAAVTQLPHTAMVVINDIATLQDIHPPNKQDVGLRLANLALHRDYGRTSIVASSPTFASMAIRQPVEEVPGQLIINFQDTAGGLKTRDGKAPSHFEIIGPGSGGFQPAQARLSGDSVLLRADDVRQPVAFRFAWHKLAEPNLMGGTGLPVGAVRGGRVPEFLDMVPDSEQLQLVYDLNLKRLGSKVTYDVDRSQSVGKFSRVAYLLELETPGGDDQKVFVSAKAFTEDATKIGVPTAATGATFQQSLQDMVIISTDETLQTDAPVTGNIEFWSSNYATANSSQVKGASDDIYDHGDEPSGDPEGYGSMQIHHSAAGQTVFAINHWSQGDNADIGIGNSPGSTRDWTFTGNGSQFKEKRLRVFVLPR